MTAEDIEHRKGLIRLYKRQLHSLQEKRARYTDLECPPHILGQIEEVEEKISELTEENVGALAREREIKLRELEINQMRMDENRRLCQMTTEELEKYLNTRRERSKLRAELEQLETELELELTRLKFEGELEMERKRELQELEMKTRALTETTRAEVQAIDGRSRRLLQLITELIANGIDDVITWWMLAALTVAPSEAAKSAAYLAILGMLRSGSDRSLSDIDVTRFIEVIEQLARTEVDLPLPTESTLKALKESVHKEQSLDRLAEPKLAEETDGEEEDGQV